MRNFVWLIFIVFFLSCTKNNTGSENSFARKEFLLQAKDNIILPAYTNLNSETNWFTEKVALFVAEPSVAKLAELRNSWKKLAISFQSCAMFNFGPAGEAGIVKSLAEEIATFPVSDTKIESLIAAKDIDFADFDRNTRGIYGIEFLIYGLNQTDEQIVELFTQNEWRKKYLIQCATHLLNKTSKILDDWKLYGQSFIDKDGTDIGSSISLYYNEFLKNYEGLKNFKFGIPLGLRPGQTAPLPQNVEAYYSGISLQLAKENWQQIKHIWEGRSYNGTDGIGFKEYLETISGGQALIASTQQQMAAIDQAFASLPDKPLSLAIQEDFEKVNAVHTELQKHTRFFKSDLSSLVGIAITYSSGDGD